MKIAKQLDGIKSITIPSITVHLMPYDAGSVGTRDIWIEGVQVNGKWMVKKPDVFAHELEHLLRHYNPNYLHPHRRGEVF